MPPRANPPNLSVKSDAGLNLAYRDTGGDGRPVVLFQHFRGNLDGWDPATDYSNEIIAMNNMYETLTRYDSQTGQVQPLLATKWTKSADAKTWTFTIRQGVKFHTGRAMTAALSVPAPNPAMPAFPLPVPV